MKRDDLKEYFRKFYSGNLLTEQEDLFGDEEDADDEAADEEGDTETEEEAAPAEEEEEEVEIEAGDEVRLNKPFEAQIDSILADFEMDALKSAQINVVDSEVTAESKWWKKSLSNILLEQEEATTEADIDIDLFASDVARLISNYDVLLDMESILYNKARELLSVKYGEEVAIAFDEILDSRHDINLASPVDGKVESPEGEIQPPLSVGAAGGDGGGA